MKKFLLTCLALLPLMAAAGEPVTVRWTGPDNLLTAPYDGYYIYYTDSAGVGFQVLVEGKLTVEHVIPDVEYGPSTWVMTSRCNACATKESPPSNELAHEVLYQGPTDPPIINEVVTFVAPAGAELTPFVADVAGTQYVGECDVKGSGKKLACTGLRIN